MYRRPLSKCGIKGARIDSLQSIAGLFHKPNTLVDRREQIGEYRQYHRLVLRQIYPLSDNGRYPNSNLVAEPVGPAIERTHRLRALRLLYNGVFYERRKRQRLHVWRQRRLWHTIGTANPSDKRDDDDNPTVVES